MIPVGRAVVLPVERAVVMPAEQLVVGHPVVRVVVLQTLRARVRMLLDLVIH